MLRLCSGDVAHLVFSGSRVKLARCQPLCAHLISAPKSTIAEVTINRVPSMPRKTVRARCWSAIPML